MMGISAIITGVFLFSYTAARSPTADLAFTCISGLWGNFGEFVFLTLARPARDANMARFPKSDRFCFSDRIRHHVRFHAGELLGPSPWIGHWYGSDIAAVRWTLRKSDRDVLGFHSRAHLRLSGHVDGGRCHRFWPAF